MKPKLIIYSAVILLISLCLNLNGLDTSKFPYIGIVASKKLDVLPEKSDNVREIATLSQNDLVTVLSKDGNWLEIKPPESITCWVSSDYISDGKISGNMVNIRQGAGLMFPVITQANRGERVTVIQEKVTGENEKWTQIAPPGSIKTWVSASDVNYFSSTENISAELGKLESGKQILDAAILSSESELSKNNYKSIDFEALKDKFYKLIMDYPETSAAKKALEELAKIQNEELRLKAEYEKTLAVNDARESFIKAESLMRSGLDPSADTDSITDLYISVIKTAPSSEEAVSSIERLAILKRKTGSINDELKTKRNAIFESAEKYQKSELSKSSNIDYDSIIRKYSDLINSYPDSSEAKKAQGKIDYIKHIKGLSKYKIAGEANSYAFEGYLIKTGISRDKDIYKIEERGLFGYKKVLCEFKSANPQIKNYQNKKVKIYGAINSFNNELPVVDLVKLELR